MALWGQTTRPMSLRMGHAGVHGARARFSRRKRVGSQELVTRVVRSNRLQSIPQADINSNGTDLH